MRKLAVALALSTTAIALASPALARDHSWYVGVEGGPNIVEDIHYDIAGVGDAGTVNSKYGYTVGGEDRQPGVSQPVDRLREVGARDDGQVEQRTRRRAHHLGVVHVDAAARQHDGIRPHGVGDTDHRAGVPGVPHVREQRDEPRRAGEHGRHRGVLALEHGDDALGAHPRVSPLLTENPGTLPPALVVTAGFDMLRDEGEAYAAHLRAHGADVETICVGNQGHGFINMASFQREAEQATGHIARRFRALCQRALARPPRVAGSPHQATQA